jgi:haemagglutination activity domain
MAAVLNRVTSTEASLIRGALQSNGRVFLINPNGIIFGMGASVDVAGLVASSLNMSDGDFLAGRMRFTATAGTGTVTTEAECRAGRECPADPALPIDAASIRTHGTGGQVYLVGRSVRPNGNITSPGGEVVIAAGESVEVINPRTPGVTVKITAGPSNTIEQFRGQMSGERISMFAGMIHIAGSQIISATTATAGANGTVVLRATGDVNVGPESDDTAFLGPQIAASKRVEIIAGQNITMSSTSSIPAVVQGGDIFLEGKNITHGTGLFLLGSNLTIAASGDINVGPPAAPDFFNGLGPRIEASKRVKMIADGNITMSCPECVIEAPWAPALVRGRDIFLKGDTITQGTNASLLGRRLTIAATGDVDLGNFSNSVARFGGKASGDVVFNNTSPTLKVDGLRVEPPHSLSLTQHGELKIKGDVISGPQTISATGNILVTPDRTGGIIVFAAGPQSIESGGDMTIRGSRDGFAVIATTDSTDLTVGGTLRLKRALFLDFRP